MGQSLINVKFEDGVFWTDTADTKIADSYTNWRSARFLRTALEDYADLHYWSDDIVEYTPPQYNTAKRNGGYTRLDFGEIGIALTVFLGAKSSGNALFVDTDDTAWANVEAEGAWTISALSSGDPLMWPPPREINLEHSYTDTGESALTLLFTGVGYLSSIDKEMIKYDLYGLKYDVDLLETATNYDGDVVVLPRALGVVTYVVPVRLADDISSHPVYHKGYVSGKVGVNWHVFDDGVDIGANVTDIGDGTFYLSASPVGEVTISGTGDITTLSGLITWVCQADRADYLAEFAGLSLSYSYSSSLESDPSPTISYWVSSQQIAIEFISEIASYFRHLFYISGYQMICVDMSKNNSSRTLTEYDFFDATYSYAPPISIIRGPYTIREAVVETIGAHVKVTDKEATISSGYPYGTDNSETVYESGLTSIEASLTDIMVYQHKAIISLQIPISSDLPDPGEQITFTDASSYQLPMTVSLHCRSIRYDAAQDIVTIEGEGDLS